MPGLLGGRYSIDATVSETPGSWRFLARDQKLDGRLVFAVVAKADAPGAADDLPRFGQLHHPGIAWLLDWVDDNNGTAVLSHVEGQTLQQLLARGEIHHATRDDFLRQLNAATAQMQDAGMSSRPLDPGDVVVQPNGQAVVVGPGTDLSGIRRLLDQAVLARTLRRRRMVLAGFAAATVLLLGILTASRMPAAARLTSGHLFFPNIELSAIQELDTARRSVVRTVPLPRGYSFYYPTPTLVIRQSDTNILVNALDEMDRPVILVLDASGRLRGSKTAPVMLLQQIAFDTSDPTQSTVIAISPYSGVVAAIDPFRSTYEKRLFVPASFMSGIAARPGGSFYLLDSRSGAIRSYQAGGALEKEIAAVEPDTSFQMAAGSDGVLWIAQRRRNTIARITPDGAVHTCSSPLFQQPISVLPVGDQVYVGSAESSQLAILNSNCETLGQVAMRGKGVGQGSMAP